MPAQRNRFIEWEPRQPAAEFSSRLVAVEIREGAGIRRPDSLFRRIVVAQDAAGYPVQAPVVAAHESLEGTRIAPASALDEQQIRQVAKVRHRVYGALLLQPVRGIRKPYVLQHRG